MESMLIDLLMLVLVAGVIYYVLQLIPLPAPFKQIALVVFAVIILIIVLTRFLFPLL